jgi:hypothetical protein
MINFSEEEKNLMAKFTRPNGWNEDEVKTVKNKIRNYFILNGIAPCCYCRRSMHKQHKLDIDTEHVLPKGQFYQYTFEMKNLNIACKRCNMGIKLEDTSFFLGGENCNDPFKSAHYSFIHPNLDVPKDHLSIKSEQSDDVLIIKYAVVNNSAKGRATYEYFKLKELEYNSIDEAQHRPTVTPELPPGIAKELALILEDA